jgi:hypothetical protein
LSVFVRTLYLSVVACCRSAAGLSLVRLFSEEEAPRLRLGSRSSAPRPVAMNGLLADPMTSANDSHAERRTLFILFLA